MKLALVIDTNVAVVANGHHASAAPVCVSECIGALSDARQQLVLIDDAGRILDEYRRNLSPRGQPGVGDAFFKWIWDNQANADLCCAVHITPLHGDDSDFEEFPADADLKKFDPDDRKFVAVALASRLAAEVLNASDTDWWQNKAALERCGLSVRFLCPELMEPIRERGSAPDRASGPRDR